MEGTKNTDVTNVVSESKVIEYGNEKMILVPADTSMNSSSLLQTPKAENNALSTHKPQSHFTTFKVMKSTAVDMNLIMELKKKNQEQSNHIQSLNDIIRQKDDEIKELRELARQINAKKMRKES